MVTNHHGYQSPWLPIIYLADGYAYFIISTDVKGTRVPLEYKSALRLTYTE